MKDILSFEVINYSKNCKDYRKLQLLGKNKRLIRTGDTTQCQ